MSQARLKQIDEALKLISSFEKKEELSVKQKKLTNDIASSYNCNITAAYFNPHTHVGTASTSGAILSHTHGS